MTETAKKTEKLIFRVPLHAAGLLDETATRQKTTRSNYLRKALAQALMRDCVSPRLAKRPRPPEVDALGKASSEPVTAAGDA
jgi:hypothetical protein